MDAKGFIGLADFSGYDQKLKRLMGAFYYDISQLCVSRSANHNRFDEPEAVPIPLAD